VDWNPHPSSASSLCPFLSLGYAAATHSTLTSHNPPQGYLTENSAYSHRLPQIFAHSLLLILLVTSNIAFSLKLYLISYIQAYSPYPQSSSVFVPFFLLFLEDRSGRESSCPPVAKATVLCVCLCLYVDSIPGGSAEATAPPEEAEVGRHRVPSGPSRKNGVPYWLWVQLQVTFPLAGTELPNTK
jgi:hypothetical protein